MPMWLQRSDQSDCSIGPEMAKSLIHRLSWPEGNQILFHLTTFTHSPHVEWV